MPSLVSWLAVAVVAAAGIGSTLWAPSFPVHHAGGIVVTGASSGIGHHAAVALAQRGFTVFACVRKDKDAAAVAALNVPGLVPLKLDVTSDESVARAAAVVAQWRRDTALPLVGLVNNAGVSMSAPIEAIPLAAYAAMHDTNVVGVLRVTQAFLPMIRADKGRVVNIGSILGIVALPVHGAYAATKMALEALTDALRREMSLFGVHVAMVNPGAVATSIVAKAVAANEALLDGMAPELSAVYSNLTRAFIKARAASFEHAAGMEVTTDAITDALCSPQPRPRYIVASVANMPANVYAWAAWLLPQRVFDSLILRSYAKYFL